LNHDIKLGDSGKSIYGADLDLIIQHDGSNGTITNATGNLTLDVAGDIILDADGGNILIKDGSVGTFLDIQQDANGAELVTRISDGDFKIRGNDGGSIITALTLDMSAAGAATFNSTVTANAGVVVDNITIDGSEIDCSSGNLVFDGASNITFDADGGQFEFKDGGTLVGQFDFTSGSNFEIQNRRTDGDITLRGYDDSTLITALTLDMSAAGAATFNSTIAAGATTFTTADNSNVLTLICTDADANSGPNVKFFRNSSSPADGDNLGRISFVANNDAAEEHSFARISATITDASNATEDGTLEFATSVATTENVSRILMGATETVINDDSADLDFRVESNGNANMLFVDAGNDRVGIGRVPTSQTFEVAGFSHFHSGAVFNEDSADVDFRVESNGNANMIRVDGGNDRVGIGESTPTKTLSVLGDAIIKNTVDGTYLTLHSTQANNASGPDIILFRDSTSPADDDALSTIFYQGKNSAGSTKDYMKVRTHIADVTDGTEDFKMDIQIMTAGNAVNALDIIPAELVINNAGIDRDFRVESSGNANMLFVDAGNDRVGIGTSSPGKLFTIGESADGTKLRLNRAGVSEWDFSIGNTSTLSGVGSGALEILPQNGGTAQELAIGPAGGGTAYVHVTASGVTFSGSISKGSGSFRIDHPLPAKTDTHHLVHSFVEAPQADNIYRGSVDLVDGVATVNIDTAAGMTDGTFVLLNTNVQCFTSNESGWTAIKGSVSGNTLTITAQDNSCTDTISWMVVGERHDEHMKNTDWTDSNGKVIVEPKKN